MLSLKKPAETEQCFCHGKIYTKVHGVSIDSITIKQMLMDIEENENVETRISQKEELLILIKTKPCKQ